MFLVVVQAHKLLDQASNLLNPLIGNSAATTRADCLGLRFATGGMLSSAIYSSISMAMAYS